MIQQSKAGEWQAKKVPTMGDPAKIPLPVDISISADGKDVCHVQPVGEVGQEGPSLPFQLNARGNCWYRLRDRLMVDPQLEHDASGRPTRSINHTLKMFLIDAEGMIREIYSLAYLQQAVMLNDMRTLALEQRPTAAGNPSRRARRAIATGKSSPGGVAGSAAAGSAQLTLRC